MKKYVFLYLLMGAFTFGFLTSCSDDGNEDDNTTEVTWKDKTGTYNGTDENLTINGAAPSYSGASVTLAASGDNAKFTVKNVIPEAAEVVFDNVTMTKGTGSYSFSSDATVGETTVTLSGTLAGDYTSKAVSDGDALALTLLRKVPSSIAGTWKLGIDEYEGQAVADFRVSASGFEDYDPLLNGMGALAGGMIAAKVSAVTLKLSDAGLFDVSWVSRETSAEVGLGAALGGLLPEAAAPAITALLQAYPIAYYVNDGRFYLAFHKAIFDMAEKMMPDLGFEEAYNTYVVPVRSLMVDNGGAYYAFPIRMDKDGDTFCHFYLTKEEIAAMAPTLSTLLGGLIPEGFQPLVSDMLSKLPSADELNVGLGFRK